MEHTLISQRIRHFRMLAKLSQEELADLVGATDNHIRKLESGDRLPSLDMILKLSNALNTTPNHLLLSAYSIRNDARAGIEDLLSDCTPTEFIILYENLSRLKDILREHIK